jgi:LPXTG-motif cell wall-anchored protein
VGAGYCKLGPNWLAKSLELAGETKENPTTENVLSLCERLVGVERYCSNTEEELKVLETMVSVLTNIPGHAEYFERRRARLREASEDFLQDTEYHRACETLQETLAHLPSPETVRILGRLLERTDDIYTREQDMWMLEQENKGKHMRWFVPAYMGGSTLLKLGLREYPKGSGPEGEFRTNDIERMRAWWAEVKSGQRAFSFKGQKVKYRFKPDGTWDTIPIANPPDDGPTPAPETTTDRPIMQSVPAEVDSHDTSRNSSWWFGIGGLVLLAAGAWFWRRNQTRRNSASP